MALGLASIIVPLLPTIVETIANLHADYTAGRISNEEFTNRWRDVVRSVKDADDQWELALAAHRDKQT